MPLVMHYVIFKNLVLFDANCVKNAPVCQVLQLDNNGKLASPTAGEKWPFPWIIYKSQKVRAE